MRAILWLLLLSMLLSGLTACRGNTRPSIDTATQSPTGIDTPAESEAKETMKETETDIQTPPPTPITMSLTTLLADGTVRAEGDVVTADSAITLQGDDGALHFTMPSGCHVLTGTLAAGALTVLRDGVAIASSDSDSPAIAAAIAPGERVSLLLHGAGTTLQDPRLTSEIPERLVTILEPVGGYTCLDGALTVHGTYIGASSVRVTAGDASVEATLATDGTWTAAITGVKDKALAVNATAEGAEAQRELTLKHVESDILYADQMDWQKATCHTSRSEPTRRQSFDAQHALTINGVRYRRGIGTHARDAGQDDAEIILAIPEGYALFEAVVGLDDHMSPDTGSGTVEFIVLLDGEIVARSGVMTPASENHTFSIDVSGAATITLRTTNGQDSAAYDAADWCDARFVKNPARDTRVLDHTAYIGDVAVGEFSYIVEGDCIAAAATVLPAGAGTDAHLSFLISAYGTDGALIGRAASSHALPIDRIHTADMVSESLTVGSTRPARVTVRVVDEDTHKSLLYTELPAAVLTRAEPRRTDLYDAEAADESRITFDRAGILSYYITAADGFGKLSVALESPATSGMSVTPTATVSLYRFHESVINTTYTAPIFSESVTIDGALTFEKRFADVPAGDYLLTILPTAGTVAVKSYAAGEATGVIYQNHRILEGALPVSIYYHNPETVQPATPEGPVAISSTATLPAEKQRAEAVYNAYLADPSTLPVSFKLGGKAYRGFGADFTETGRTSTTSGDKRTTAITLRHTSGLVVTLDMATYYDYAAFEWTVYFTNATNENSPIISELRAADITFAGDTPTLNGLHGDAINEISTEIMNNQPYTTVLEASKTYRFASRNGRPTDTCFPYYDLTYGDRGVLMAIGWEGQWASSFRYEGGKTRFTAGQESFNAYLKPGETARTPLMAFVLYDGRNSDRATNLWRHWFIDCNMPETSDGRLEPVLGGTTSDRTGCMTLTNEAYQIEAIQNFFENGIELDYWWMDAGWYTISVGGQGITELLQYGITGTWVVDTKRFPTKFKAISDVANALGCKTLLWFEPERFGLDPSTLKTDGSTLRREWLITSPEGWKFVNYGDPDAVAWMTERVIGILEEGGISIYREDFNVPPLSAWKATDEKNRVGMTENLYVQGHLRFWDNLRAHFPGMILDTCASGGRRNDLESLRRAVPLHISDYFLHDLNRRQGVHYALQKWFPFFKAEATPNCLEADEYALRNALVAWPQLQFDFTRPGVDLEVAQDFVALWRECSPYLYSDYYTLTDWSIDDDEWIGWMFIEETGGFAQLFRRPGAPDSERHIKLKGLDPAATYELIDADGHCGGTFTGFELTEHGVTVIIPEAGSSAVIRIVRK